METAQYDLAVAPLEWELVVECEPFPPEFDPDWTILYVDEPPQSVWMGTIQRVGRNTVVVNTFDESPKQQRFYKQEFDAPWTGEGKDPTIGEPPRVSGPAGVADAGVYRSGSNDSWSDAGASTADRDVVRAEAGSRPVESARRDVRRRERPDEPWDDSRDDPPAKADAPGYRDFVTATMGQIVDLWRGRAP